MNKNFDFGNPICNANQCTIDAKLHVCPNCFRTREEIDFWDEYSATDKQMILRTIEHRKAVAETVNGETDLRWVF